MKLTISIWAKALKKYFFQSAVLCLLVFGSFSGLIAQDIPSKPSPARLVNDYVGVLSAFEINDLEQKLVAFDDSTSNQVVVVVVKTVQPYDMNEYATKLGREWGVGQDGKNNGLVVLWATEDRKVYIATGYGLEGAIPDAIAKRIVDQVIIPRFRESRFYDGLRDGTDAIIQYSSGEFEAEPESSDEIPFWLILLIFLIIIIIIRAISKGGGGGGMMRRSSGWPYTTYTGWGQHSGNWSGGGWGGSSGGWGGGGGGGFGGFGGGSFGGGGAGGSY